MARSNSLLLLVLACALACATAQNATRTTRCTLDMTSADESAYTSVVNCSGATPLMLVAHQSTAAVHNVSYWYNGRLVGDNAGTRPLGNRYRHLTFSADASSMLTFAFSPDSPCSTGTANCSLEVRTIARSLVMPPAHAEGKDPAYSVATFNDIGTLSILDSTFDIVKNEVYIEYDPDYNRATLAENVSDSTYLFDETYHTGLAAATIVCNNSMLGSVNVQRSRFSFSGNPVSLSDYFTYYGGPRSFPNAQLSGLLLLASGDNGGYLTVNVTDSTFTGHIASRGAGIHVPRCPYSYRDSQGPARINIRRSRFEDNQAFIKGGAVFVGRQCAVTIANTTFLNNSIVSTEQYWHRVMDEFNFRGGAVYAYTPQSLVIADSVFRNNTANPLPWSGLEGIGGAVHIDINHTVTPNSTTEVLIEPDVRIGPNVEFTGNSAWLGGAVGLDDTTYNLWWEGEAYVNIVDSIFRNNTAETGAGALYISGPSKWAAITSYRIYVSIVNSSLVNNTAGVGSGGAVYAEQLYALTLLNSSISSNNISKGSGGALAAKYINSLSILNSNFDSNTARTDAGAISIESAWAVVFSSLFRGNAAVDGVGGAIKSSPASLFVERAVFDGNSAGVSGGAIAIEQGRGTRARLGLYHPGLGLTAGDMINLTDVIRARDGSGEITTAMETASLSGDHDYNSLEHTPFFYPLTSLQNVTAHVSETSFMRNRAGELGGAVSISGGALLLNISTLEGNTATAGGALAAVDCVGAVNIYATSFVGNTARGSGGAVALNSCSAGLNATHISSSQAAAGGAVYSGLSLANSNASERAVFALELNQCNVTQNQARSGAGGGLLVRGSDVTLRGGRIGPGNSAALTGGALSITVGELVQLEGPVVADNVAGNLQERRVEL